MMARCEGNEIEVLERVFLPHSLGSFYTMICEFIGYKKYGDEGKVMGLAPYGKDTYCEQDPRDRRTQRFCDFRLDLDYFIAAGKQSGHADSGGRNGATGAAFLRPHGEAFGEPREPHAEITQRDMDLAYAMQHRFEEVFFPSAQGIAPTRAVCQTWLWLGAAR